MKRVNGLKQARRIHGTLRTPNKFGELLSVKAEVRFDDQLGNGHNSFAITGEAWSLDRRERDCVVCGCIHEEIAASIPMLAPLLKWHLVSTDGPMHYVSNSLYWLKKDNLDSFKKTSLWGVLYGETDEGADRIAETYWEEGEVAVAKILNERLPELIALFRRDMEGFGFKWDFQSFPAYVAEDKE